MKRDTLWKLLAGVLIGIGLTVVGFFVLLALAMQSWGSNK